MIVNKRNSQGNKMSKMLVYHGGYLEVSHPIVISGKRTKDFGDGFYCTIIKEEV